MRKRPHPEDDSEGPPMRKFKRPHTGSAFSPGIESSKFDLNVLVCAPQFGKYHHWAMQLYNRETDDGTIFEIQGAHPSYEFTTYQCRPRYYPLRVLKTLRLGQLILSSSGLESIEHAIEKQVLVRNDYADWTCQDYILDVLEMLEEEWWLDTDDNEYMDVKEKLRGMRGEIKYVQEAVAAYSKASMSSKESSGGADPKKNLEPRSARVSRTF